MNRSDHVVIKGGVYYETRTSAEPYSVFFCGDNYKSVRTRCYTTRLCYR